MITNNNIPQSLFQLIQKVQENNSYLKAIESFQDQYNIHGTNVDFLTPEIVLQTYSTIKKKQMIQQIRFYYDRKSPANCSWFENELRIYIWILICYLYLNNQKIQQMVPLFLMKKTYDDWLFFKPIFYNREPIIFQFQGILLQKRKTSKWTEDQIKLLEKIVKIKTMKNKWNSVARQLYILSEKKYIKTPKQCRERWLNYLDPSKVHSPWTSQQDLSLLLSIKEYGKKWAFTVKKLLKKRTEHMVKNRFNSLINNEKKKIGNKPQCQLIQNAIETAKLSERSQVEIKQQQFSEELSFSDKEINDQESQSLFVQKKAKNPRKPKAKKKQPIKKTLKKNIISSIPTEISLQKQDLKPADINKRVLSDSSEPISFFQEFIQDIQFNPFDEITPNESIKVHDFFNPNEYGSYLDYHGSHAFKQNNAMNLEPQNGYY